MRANLRSLELDPHPAELPADPSDFHLLARMIVGPSDAPGEESFDVVVCSPEWMAQACRQFGGIYDARHHIVVDAEAFDQRVLRTWLEARVQKVQADTWSEIGERIGRLGHWEFEDYQP